MMTENTSNAIVPEVLTESRTARSSQLKKMSHEQAQDILNKVKALYFAAIKNKNVITTEQLAEFYEVSTDAILNIEKRHHDEFEPDGLEVLRGKALKEVADELAVSPFTPQVKTWTAKAALRMGMMLRESETARQVRDMMIHLATVVLPSIATPKPEPQPQPAPKAVPDINASIHLLNSLLDPLAATGIDMRLLQSAKMSAIAVQHPEYQQLLEATKENLTQLTPDEDKRCTPTRLGELYAEKHNLEKPVQAHKINKALEAAGFQINQPRTNSKGKEVTNWILTPDGEEFGKIFLESAQNCSKTLSVIRWLPSVLDAIVIAE